MIPNHPSTCLVLNIWHNGISLIVSRPPASNYSDGKNCNTENSKNMERVDGVMFIFKKPVYRGFQYLEM